MLINCNFGKQKTLEHKRNLVTACPTSPLEKQKQGSKGEMPLRHLSLLVIILNRTNYT